MATDEMRSDEVMGDMSKVVIVEAHLDCFEMAGDRFLQFFTSLRGFPKTKMEGAFVSPEDRVYPPLVTENCSSAIKDVSADKVELQQAVSLASCRNTVDCAFMGGHCDATCDDDEFKYPGLCLPGNCSCCVKKECTQSKCCTFPGGRCDWKCKDDEVTEKDLCIGDCVCCFQDKCPDSPKCQALDGRCVESCEADELAVPWLCGGENCTCCVKNNCNQTKCCEAFGGSCGKMCHEGEEPIEGVVRRSVPVLRQGYVDALSPISCPHLSRLHQPRVSRATAATSWAADATPRAPRRASRRGRLPRRALPLLRAGRPLSRQRHLPGNRRPLRPILREPRGRLSLLLPATGLVSAASRGRQRSLRPRPHQRSQFQVAQTRSTAGVEMVTATSPAMLAKSVLVVIAIPNLVCAVLKSRVRRPPSAKRPAASARRAAADSTSWLRLTFVR
nr:uncharacterized protein LOC113801986 [Penaeus vannamei]